MSNENSENVARKGISPSAKVLNKRKVLYGAGVIVSFIVGTFLGPGIIFQWASLESENERALRDRLDLETKLISQLYEYESQIHSLVPRYVSARDQLSDEDGRDLEFDAVRYQLAGLFVSYNKLEAKLSLLERRGAQFLLPSQLIPPRSPKITGVNPVPDSNHATADKALVRVQFTLRPDPVVESVSKQLQGIFDQYDDSFRDRYYLRLCDSGAGTFCTALAMLRSEPNEKDLDEEVLNLYKRGCELEDPKGCEALAHYDFNRKQYRLAGSWLIKGCHLASATACGFLGSLQVSDLLDEAQDPEAGRLNLEKGCKLRSARSCYYLAILYISGLVHRDVEAARSSLEEACALTLDEACRSLEEFEDFQKCSPDAIHSLEGDGATMTIECVRPTTPKSSR